jgi:hypothetical protein
MRITQEHLDIIVERKLARSAESVETLMILHPPPQEM